MNDKLRTLKDLHEKAITEILNDGSIKDLDKMLTKFGEQNGYPVIFVVTAKTFDPPKEDIAHSAIITDQLDVKCFKSNEMHEAADYAQKISGVLGAFDPRIDSKEFQKELDKQKRIQTVNNNAMIEHFNKMVEKYKLQDLVTQVEATGQNEFTAILPLITAPEDRLYYYNSVICHLQ